MMNLLLRVYDKPLCKIWLPVKSHYHKVNYCLPRVPDFVGNAIKRKANSAQIWLWTVARTEVFQVISTRLKPRL